jgi:dihydroorotate dehydrogenase electron transfer subunit
MEQEQVAPDGFRMRLEVPDAQRYGAGQFLHVRVDESACQPLLRRPFSTWDAGEGWVDVLYAVKGQGTKLLAAKRAGDRVGVLGPLGNRLTPPDGRAVFVAGGVGIVPFLMLARGSPGATLLFGARGAPYLYGLPQLRRLPIEIHVATDDGSAGFHGKVTELFERRIERGARVYGCGPDPMLRALARIVRREGLWCEMSLETRMGCALGACRACVTPVRDDGGWRYSRVCCEGPNYNVEELVLE